MLGGVCVPAMLTQANLRRKKAGTISTGQLGDHVRTNTIIVVNSMRNQGEDSVCDSTAEGTVYGGRHLTVYIKVRQLYRNYGVFFWTPYQPLLVVQWSQFGKFVSQVSVVKCNDGKFRVLVLCGNQAGGSRTTDDKRSKTHVDYINLLGMLSKNALVKYCFTQQPTRLISQKSESVLYATTATRNSIRREKLLGWKHFEKSFGLTMLAGLGSLPAINRPRVFTPFLSGLRWLQKSNAVPNPISRNLFGLIQPCIAVPLPKGINTVYVDQPVVHPLNYALMISPRMVTKRLHVNYQARRTDQQLPDQQPINSPELPIFRHITNL
ncbi:hypothetical protein CLF_112849 [Clonorchis sinensis]|uniref:Uncharacterized protein n=1 Tax=Clonorchis sinensis TaxID=79923 RepID=G7YX48_CLOSI|nr:hypothetical protein CLF_112849 [Clonorchis sinensis]